MSDTPPNAIDARVIRETLAGYKLASEYISAERQSKLAAMTPEESTAIFVALLDSGYALLGDRSTLHVFDDARLASTLLVRQVFEEAAAFERPT